jgi:hypothetical protein
LAKADAASPWDTRVSLLIGRYAARTPCASKTRTPSTAAGAQFGKHSAPSRAIRTSSTRCSRSTSSSKNFIRSARRCGGSGVLLIHLAQERVTLRSGNSSANKGSAAGLNSLGPDRRGGAYTLAATVALADGEAMAFGGRLRLRWRGGCHRYLGGRSMPRSLLSR